MDHQEQDDGACQQQRLLSFSLSRAPGLSLVLNRYARFFFPFILIWLGGRILLESGSLQWLRSLAA